MRKGHFQKPGLFLLFGCLLLQTYVLLGNTLDSIEPDMKATPRRQAAPIAAVAATNDTVSMGRVSLLVLGIGAVCFGLSIAFSTRRAPQTKASIVRLSTSTRPLSHEVPRRWSEDIVPLKLKASKEPGELSSRGIGPSGHVS